MFRSSIFVFLSLIIFSLELAAAETNIEVNVNTAEPNKTKVTVKKKKIPAKKTKLKAKKKLKASPRPTPTPIPTSTPTPTPMPTPTLKPIPTATPMPVYMPTPAPTPQKSSSEHYRDIRSGFAYMKGVFLNPLANAQILKPLNTDSDTVIGFQGGLEMQYFYHPNIGIFAQLTAAQKGFEAAGQKAKQWFLDSSIGPVLGLSLSDFTRLNLLLGGFYAQPFKSRYTGSLTPTFGNKTKYYFGLNGGLEVLIAMTRFMGAGINVTGRLPFGSPVKGGGSDIRFVEMGAGLMISFGFPTE